MAGELPNGDPSGDGSGRDASVDHDRNEFARTELEKGRDIVDIARDLGIGADPNTANADNKDVRVHTMEAGATPPSSAVDDQVRLADIHSHNLANGTTQGGGAFGPAGNTGTYPGNSDGTLSGNLSAANSGRPTTAADLNPPGLTYGHGANAAPSQADPQTPTLNGGQAGAGVAGGPPPTDPHYNTRLGDTTGLPNGDPTAQHGTVAPAGGFQKNTHDFYQGEYTPGKGVADKDGYFDANYHSEANIMNNARNGDDAAFAKLEVMANAGDPNAKEMIRDLGTRAQFEHSQIHADWVGPHDKQINTDLGAGAYAGNKEDRLNLAAQREDPVKDLQRVKESNPAAAEMMDLVSKVGGRDINYDAQGVTFTDKNNDVHQVPIGQIERSLGTFRDIVNTSATAAAEQQAAYEATKNKGRGATAPPKK